MKFLAVSAHPDDLEGGVAGTICRLHKAGHEIVSLVTTAGKLGQTYNEGADLTLQVRLTECIKAHAVLGIIPICLARHEQEYTATPKARAEFQGFVAAIKPDVIIAHWPIDVHPDHRVCGELAAAVALQKGVNTELFFFEEFSSGRRSAENRPQSLGFYPTHYVDITKELDTKRAMLECHTSQDPAGMWHGKQQLHKSRGEEAGMQNAEAFIRVTRVGDLCQELAEIFVPTRFQLPRAIGVDFSPQAIGL